MMQIDEDARLSRYKKNIALLREMAEIEELDGFKTQILNVAESYMKLVESIDWWETSLKNKSSSAAFVAGHPAERGNAPDIKDLRWPSR